MGSSSRVCSFSVSGQPVRSLAVWPPPTLWPSAPRCECQPMQKTAGLFYQDGLFEKEDQITMKTEYREFDKSGGGT